MRAILFIFVCLLLCQCNQSRESNFPAFETNASLGEVSDDITHITSRNDFNIVFFTRADLSYGWYKIFAFQSGRWVKIDVRENLPDANSKPDKTISRDIVTRSTCSEEEAKIFLSSLKQLHLFDLPEEDEVRRNCKKRDVEDVEEYYIQIIEGGKVRSLMYSDVFNSQSRCSQLTTWTDLINIEKLFKDKWVDLDSIK